MSGSKHDADCLRRKREDERLFYVCTCDMTDAEVRHDLSSYPAELKREEGS